MYLIFLRQNVVGLLVPIYIIYAAMVYCSKLKVDTFMYIMIIILNHKGKVLFKIIKVN